MLEDYEYQKVKESVERGIELLGGAELFVKPGEKILFKPNWPVADSPDKQAFSKWLKPAESNWLTSKMAG